MQISENFRSKPPRGGLWKLAHPISGTLFSSHQLGALKESIWRHEEANGYPRTSEKEIENLLCQSFPVSCGENQPSIFEKAANFAVAMADWASKGFPVVTEEQLQVRLDICRECEWFRGFAGNSLFHTMCGRCGCSGLKIQIRDSHCPISKW